MYKILGFNNSKEPHSFDIYNHKKSKDNVD